MPFPGREVDQTLGVLRSVQCVRLESSALADELGVVEHFVRESALAWRAGDNPDLALEDRLRQCVGKAFQMDNVEELWRDIEAPLPSSSAFELARGRKPRDLAHIILAGFKFGYSRLPASWLVTENMSQRRRLRAAIAEALELCGYQDVSGWPEANSLRKFYSEVDDPADRISINSIPAATGNLLVGNFRGLCDVRPAVDLIVSLCRTGVYDAPFQGTHVEFWLNDRSDRRINENGPAVVENAARLVADRLESGESVFVHCAVGRSRSPGVAAKAIQLLEDVPIEAALQRVRHYMPFAEPLTIR